ncbi:GNAT family N-acetyltransferase [Kitasatospora sp. NBC_01250]|uniref:GNAT family N-acetyltransferase n=1 Tax=Kitasatospora sp. NBC_01250 TaxID=2903571 RepID=UPI002E302FC9|nr:GNAT family N-acetyltransferase [Kitasatospora sp. NBC_01250]
MIDAAELRDAYDRQLRSGLDGPDTVRDQDGPLIRHTGESSGFVNAPRDLGLRGAELDELIHRQLRHFAPRSRRLEWKVRGHDLPAELPERLRAAGFTAQPTTTVLAGRSELLAPPPGREPALPAGVTVRRLTDPAEADRIAALEAAVWGEYHQSLADFLHGQLTDHPEGIAVLAAESGGQLISTGWLVLRPGSDFGALLGGATLAEWRGRGVYQALVAQRARIAHACGHRYLQVDASEHSAPILRRLGLIPITTSTRYIWTPPPLPRTGEDGPTGA